MATVADVRAIFEARLKEGIPNLGEFHSADLERAKDDKYLKRILIHQENDAKAAADMLWDICVWRKTVGANDLNESNINMDYIREGAFFPRGRDVDGCLLLVFKSKMHNNKKDIDELKKCVIYWFDRVERQENGKPISLFFDMEGCGLSNMDMEFTKYLISLMKLYYPLFLNLIIIYQMPWVLSAAFKVIKSLLPAKAASKMKFLNKDNLKEAVTPDQALVCWGGKDDYVFEFVSESKGTDSTPKKVTFAEQSDSQHSLGEMLRLSPSDTIVFKTENDEVSGQFTITNMDDSAISFKIRTTSPEKFRVRPSTGTLMSGASQNVSIVVLPGFLLRSVTKDRFLVMSVQIPKPDVSQKEIVEIWQKSSGSKVDEYRLKCHFPEKETTRNGMVLEARESEKGGMSDTLTHIEQNYQHLSKQVRFLKIFQLATLLMSSVAVFLGFLIYRQNTTIDGNCERF